MRNESERQATMMLGLTPEGFVPKGHPLRRIKHLADSALWRMSPLFDEIYADNGRPRFPPEHLLKSGLLMAFYTVRSERQFGEQLRCNLLFKWFLALKVEDEPFHPATFTKNRERPMRRGCCSRKWSGRRAGGGCSRPTTSPWTARCWKPGPRTRATVGPTSNYPEAAGATTTPTSRASAVTARRMSRRPTLRGGALPQGQAADGQALPPGLCADRESLRAGGRCRADRSRPLFKPGAGGYAGRDADLTDDARM